MGEFGGRIVKREKKEFPFSVILRRIKWQVEKTTGFSFFIMIEPTEFVERWTREIVATNALPDDLKLCTASQEQVRRRALTSVCSQFLTQAGLPSSCAPFLTFKDVEKGIPRLWEVYSPVCWQPFEKNRVLQYAVIGGDGCGNAICLDESAECRVALVDHETLFGRPGFWRNRHMPRVQYMNQSVPQLAESLLTYALFGRKLRELGYSFISETMPLEPVKWLESELRRIDESAILKEAFWYYELQGLMRESA